MNRSVLASTGNTVDLPELAARMKHTNVSVIKEMMYLGAQEKAKGKDVISLGVGIPYYPAPFNIHSHAVETIKSKPDIDKYTLLTGLPKLRSLIARKESTNLGFSVSEEEILVTAGSMAGLFYSFLTLVDEGDEVILPSPYFSSYGEQIALAGGKIVPVPLVNDGKTGYRLNVAAIKRSINRKTKAIVINNPQNPTGAVFLKEDLTAIARYIKNKSIYIITDEVYDFLTYDDSDYFNIASIRHLWPRIIRCCSFSKKYGMMGWRIGYVHTNSKLLMHILKVHDANIVCAPHISQEAAIEALTINQDCVVHHVKWLSDNRDIICRRLDKLPDLFSYVRPKGTYYIFPKYHLNLSSIVMAKRLLYEAGVVTVPGIGFGPEGEYHLRLSFGAPVNDINKAFNRIDVWWKKNR